METTEAIDDARRSMQICNSCRYCEGYCAVFPAMEQRTVFTNEDLAYLANLCHNCRGCLYACQYSPPHAFNLNLPRTLAQVRNDTYKFYAWPASLAGVFERNGVVLSIITAIGLAAVLALVSLCHSPAVLYGRHTGPGAFYLIVPFFTMTSVASATFLFSAVAMTIGFLKFWRDIGGNLAEIFEPQPLGSAAADAMFLKYLGGSDSGGGCNDKNEAFSTTRRNYHHFLFYGFLLCTASTIVAGIYDHFLHWMAPYPFFSLPVMLGTAGGIGMVIGCGGLLALKVTADQTPSAPNLLGADVALILLLGLAALSGLLLLGLRATSAMGILLSLHLGFILALFVVLPYSRFVHGMYRSGALLKFAIEKKRARTIIEIH
jgi:citrate/tricarballylate utilization protein